MGDPSRARVRGPLQEYAAGFVAELARLGYTRESACGQMFLMGHLSRWLAGEGLDAGGLTPEAAERFLAARRVGAPHINLTARYVLRSKVSASALAVAVTRAMADDRSAPRCRGRGVRLEP